jgi:3-oxoacyl-[acyl-carrier protein] reductase
MSWLRLANQTAIVTGAGSGLGRAVALALAEQSCNLFLIDVNSNNLENVVSECTKVVQMIRNPPNIHVDSSICDVRDKLQVEKAVQKADMLAASSSPCRSGNSESFSNPPYSVASILVNCAGITRDGRISNISDTDWDDVLDINLKGTFHMCQQFCEPRRVATLLQRPYGNNVDDSLKHHEKIPVGGSIINIGSIVSEYGNMGQVNYAASKGGVVGLTRSLAKEMALFSRGKVTDDEEEVERAETPPAIRVNCIQPGFIHTPMAHAVPDKILSKMKEKIALRRFGQAEDVANLALFLASSARSGYITGEILECSGMLRL